MEIVSLVLSALLFVGFVPGVIVKIPKGGSTMHVVITHAILFALVTSLVMRFYWTNIKGYIETFANYGPSCPNGYTPGVNQGGIADCIPTGHATYPATSK